MPDIKLPATPAKPLLPLVALTALLSLGAGGYAGYRLGVIGTSDVQFKAGHTAGWTEAKKKVSESGMFTTLPTTVLNGTVEEIKGDSLTVRVPQLVRNPLDEPAPLLRTIIIAKDTKITATTPKPQAEQREAMNVYSEAQKKFSEALMSGETNVRPPMPPQPFIEKELKLSELVKGATVVVGSSGDVTSAPSIEAKSIRVQSSMLTPTELAPVVPPPPPPPQPNKK